MGNCTSDNNADASIEFDPAIPPSSVQGTCPICMETTTLTFQYVPEQNEHFINNPCTHRFCSDCLGQYVGLKCSDSEEWDIKCPMPGCAYHLTSLDVRRLTTSANHLKWTTRRNGSHMQRFLSNDPELLKMLNIEKELEWYRERSALRAEYSSGDAVDGSSIFGVGSRVMAPYLSSTGRKYPGVIVTIESNLASIAYDDGDFWSSCPLNTLSDTGFCSTTDAYTISLRRLKDKQQAERANHLHSQSKIFTYKEGMRVLAGWKNGTTKYPGTIKTYSTKNQTAEIQYDDGDHWSSCPMSLITLLSSVCDLKTCPRCYVLIEKSEGCDSMMCTCGSVFGWRDLDVLPEEVLKGIEERRKEEGKYVREGWEEFYDTDECSEKKLQSQRKRESRLPEPVTSPKKIKMGGVNRGKEIRKGMWNEGMAEGTKVF